MKFSFRCWSRDCRSVGDPGQPHLDSVAHFGGRDRVWARHSTRRRPPSAATNSPAASCSANGSKSSMPGSSTIGRPTATWLALAGRPGCPRRSARCCGRSSSACGRPCDRAASITERPAVHRHSRRRSARTRHPAFDFAVVDEAQDLSVAAAAVPRRPRAPDGPTRCSSPATSGSASSSSRSRGRRSASTSAAARARCASTTAPRTRSAARPTGCSGPS